MMKKRLLAVGLLLVACVAVLHAVATYPSGIASFPTRVNGQTIDATWFNSLQDEVVAIETGLINGIAHVLKPQSNATYDLGTSGLQWNNVYLAGKIYQGATNPYTGWTVVTSTNTGTQNDFAPGLSGHTVVRMNNATLATITGFAGGYDGQRVLVVSIGAGQVDIPHQSASSVAANRIINTIQVASSTTSLKASLGLAEFLYDGTTTRWRMVRHDQGGSIDYSATSTVTGWASFTSKKIYYEVIGSRVYVDFDIEGTSNATGVSFTLPFTPTNAPIAFALGEAEDNTVFGANAGVCLITAATVACYPTNAQGNWTNAGTKVVVGQFSFQAN